MKALFVRKQLFKSQRFLRFDILGRVRGYFCLQTKLKVFGDPLLERKYFASFGKFFSGELKTSVERGASAISLHTFMPVYHTLKLLMQDYFKTISQ